MADLTVEPAQGSAPLSVTFTGGSGGASFFGGIQIEFGDGETGFFCRPGRSCKDTTATHVYAKPGTYTARLVGQGEGGQRELMAISIKVD